jgi:catechol 2,3-dioxygenase-like lactoylglutathione lyase family enzyme
MPLVQRLLETALYCDDLPRALGFYRDLLGLATMFADDRLAAIDAGRGTVLLLFRRGASASGVPLRDGRIPAHDGAGPVHVAFAVEAAELPGLEARLAARGVAIESRIRWSGGGESLYCRDPDGHSVEFATPGVWPTY